METQKEIAVFESEYEFQVDLIASIYQNLNAKLAVFEKETASREMIESTGYWMHNLYCAFEDLFKLVSAFWENNLSVNGDYHVNLLKRMMIHIKDVRPPLLSKDSYEYLNELRGFRHVFRHAYGFGLDDERVAHLIRKTIAKKVTVLADLSKFQMNINTGVQRNSKLKI
jgi:hypothetical protein